MLQLQNLQRSGMFHPKQCCFRLLFGQIRQTKVASCLVLIAQVSHKQLHECADMVACGSNARAWLHAGQEAAEGPGAAHCQPQEPRPAEAAGGQAQAQLFCMLPAWYCG